MSSRQIQARNSDGFHRTRQGKKKGSFGNDRSINNTSIPQRGFPCEPRADVRALREASARCPKSKLIMHLYNLLQRTQSCLPGRIWCNMKDALFVHVAFVRGHKKHKKYMNKGALFVSKSYLVTSETG